jgi:hypothetical protein
VISMAIIKEPCIHCNGKGYSEKEVRCNCGAEKEESEYRSKGAFVKCTHAFTCPAYSLITRSIR